MVSRKRKVVMCIVIGLCYLEWGSLLSLLAPFYPSEAEHKGATPSEVSRIYNCLIIS